MEDGERNQCTRNRSGIYKRNGADGSETEEETFCRLVFEAGRENALKEKRSNKNPPYKKVNMEIDPEDLQSGERYDKTLG